ncbi:MAG: amino acid permease [Saprospiraceae bacterium]|nr:amino acid permease [Pyrinomonadaceae bacterium]
MSTSLFRKKSIAQIQTDAAIGMTEHEQEEVGGEGGGLRRTLKFRDLTLMGIAAIIGAGIFAMIGGASYRGGPGVIFLFAFSAIACGFSALCYADFASRIPIAGSAYTYSYASFGELFAWIIGWDLIVEYAIGNIAVAISWSDYFTRLMSSYNLKIPAFLTMDYLSASRGFADNGEVVATALGQGYTIDGLSRMKGDDLLAISDKLTTGTVEAYEAWTTAPMIADWRVIADVPALVMTVLITILVYIGIRESKIVGNTMTILKIAIILLVIVLGAFFVTPENWTPFLPNGISGVMAGVAAVFFAYIGFDALSTTAEECENPRRDLPRAMIFSLAICTVLYIALALVLTGMEPFGNLNVGDPLAFVFRDKLPWLAGVIAVSAVIALATVFLVFQIGQPRLWMAMSRDGLLPKIFSSIHPRFRTPWFSTIVTGIVVAIPALFMNLTEVTDLGVIGTLFAFTLVCGGILIKDKEFGRENRYVPFISARFIAPVLLVVTVFLVIYGNGVAAFSDLNTKISDGTLTEEITDNQRQAALNFDAYSLSNLGNSHVYAEGFNAVGNFFEVKPDVETGESWLGAFSHKIPYIVFFIFSVLMVIFAFIKRFSLIPFLGVMCCTYLMTELGIINWTRFGIWLLVGVRIYRAYGFRNSKLNTGNETPSILLRAGSIVADFVLLFVLLIPFIIAPLIGYFFDFDMYERLGQTPLFIISLLIAVGLEGVSSARERITTISE